MLLVLAVVTQNVVGQVAESPVPSAVLATNPVPANPESPVAASGTSVEKAVEPTASVLPEVPVTTAAVVAAESSIPVIEPEISDAGSEPNIPWTEPESRTRRAMRVNRSILMVTVPILAFFILARIALLWKISSNRKRIARESNSLEG